MLLRPIAPLLFALVTLVATLPVSAQSITVGKPAKTLFSIRTEDEKTGAVLPGQYTIQMILAKRQLSGQSTVRETFTFVLEKTDTLVVVTKTPGYLDMEETLLVSCDTCTNYEYVAKMEARPVALTLAAPANVFVDLTPNKIIRLDNVYFDQSSYVLRPESYPQLNQLVNTLKTTPALQIEIAGHTDNVGDRRLNQALSENRARVIRHYLTTNGVAETRLRPVGYGDSRPAAPNDSEENKRKNRRVEVVVQK
jgi:OmpA-OmpF porin, OOP family